MTEKPHRFASRASNARPTMAQPSSVNTKEKLGTARAITYRENSNCMLARLAAPDGRRALHSLRRGWTCRRTACAQNPRASGSPCPIFHRKILSVARPAFHRVSCRRPRVSILRYSLVYIGEHGMVGAQIVKHRHRTVTGDDLRLPVHGFDHAIGVSHHALNRPAC